jgi:hypothetical protein
VQDPTVESAKRWLLELKMADLERFWRKTPLGPLGVKNSIFSKLDLLSKIGISHKPLHFYFGFIQMISINISIIS